MTERELLDHVRRLRAQGSPPKAIARALWVRPATIARLVRRVAAEAPATPPDEAPLAGCWVSPAWSEELLVQRRDGWEDVELGPGGPAGVALVLVARSGRRDEVTVCGYLVDTFCLGVKDTVGPRRMRRRDLPASSACTFAPSRRRRSRRRSTWPSISSTGPWRSRPAWGSGRIPTSGRQGPPRRVA